MIGIRPGNQILCLKEDKDLQAGRQHLSKTITDKAIDTPTETHFNIDDNSRMLPGKWYVRNSLQLLTLKQRDQTSKLKILI